MLTFHQRSQDGDGPQQIPGRAVWAPKLPPRYFAAMIQKVLQLLIDQGFCTVFVDDILVHSKDVLTLD